MVANSGSATTVYEDELPDELTTMIDELCRHCKNACEQFNPLDIQILEDEESGSDQEPEPGSDSARKRKVRSSEKAKQGLTSRAKLFGIIQKLKDKDLIVFLDEAMASPRQDGGDKMAHPGMSAHPNEMAKVENVHKLAQSKRSLQFPVGPAIWADEERFDLEKCLDDGLLRRSGDRMAKMRQTKEASALAKYCGALSKLSVVEKIVEPMAEQVRSPKLTVASSQSSYILMTYRVVAGQRRCSCRYRADAGRQQRRRWHSDHKVHPVHERQDQEGG